MPAPTPDRRAALTASLGVGAVALTAAVISFSHVQSLALRAGESQLASWLLPISIDGAIAAAAAVLLADSRAGRRPAALTWLLFGLGLAASLTANIASADHSATARAVAAWPPIALAIGIEVLAGLGRHGGTGIASQPATWMGDQAGMPAHVRTGMSANGGRPALAASRPVSPATGRIDALGNRRPRLSDLEAVEIIRELDAEAAGGCASRIQIQDRLGCGGSRAARLAQLARSAESLGLMRRSGPAH